MPAFGDDGVLCEFQRYEERLLLSLRAVFAQWHAAYGEYDVVAVHASGGELVDYVTLPVFGEQFRQRPFVELRPVAQVHRLAVER